MPADLGKVDPSWAWAPFEPDERLPWNRRRAAHLYRRAGFAANTRQLDEAIAMSPQELVAVLMQPEGVEQFQSEMDRFGRTILSAGNSQGLSAWWLYRMLHTPAQLLEKTTLFWHGHFATSAEKVTNARLMLDQNALLRDNALGSFTKMVNAISRDPAMLIYLDSSTNRKTHPNENYARELLELFCLGLGNYTEKDIQDVARCFTGWEVRRDQFRFNKYQHDTGEKRFLGKRGVFDGDEAVRIVVQQDAAPKFIARKLVAYFLLDEPAPPDELIEPLARQIRDSDFVIGPTVERILGSRLMFSSHAIGRKIRSPIELAVGFLRALEGTTNLTRLSSALAVLGQSPFFPPNVKGWEGGRTWINSSTLLGRMNLVRRLTMGDESRFADGELGQYIERHAGTSAAQMVDWLLELLVAVPIPVDAKEALIRLAGSASRDADRRASTVIQAVAALPEFQLC